jgi:hypothetical protein
LEWNCGRPLGQGYRVGSSCGSIQSKVKCGPVVEQRLGWARPTSFGWTGQANDHIKPTDCKRRRTRQDDCHRLLAMDKDLICYCNNSIVFSWMRCDVFVLGWGFKCVFVCVYVFVYGWRPLAGTYSCVLYALKLLGAINFKHIFRSTGWTRGRLSCGACNTTQTTSSFFDVVSF